MIVVGMVRIRRNRSRSHNPVFNEMENGQASMDFIVAITIFTFGLVLLIFQVPMLFAPLQTGYTDIRPVAYRTSMILAEDGGIRNTTGILTSDWENETNYTNILRIGLAMRAPDWSSSEDIVPNNLSRKKIDRLQNLPPGIIRERLGLFVTFNNISLNYSFNISLRPLRAFDEKLIMNKTTQRPLLQVGDSIPVGGLTIAKIERIVAIENTTGLTGIRTIAGHESAKLVIYIWR